MNHVFLVLAAAILVNGVPAGFGAADPLLEKEVGQLRDNQDLVKRADLYNKFALLRLETAKKRMQGAESKEGDPFEFHSIEDLISGYSQAMRSFESNIDDVTAFKNYDVSKINSALTKLKSGAEKSRPFLDEALQYAIMKKDESLYNTVKEALEITDAAVEGAKAGLEKFKNPKKEKKK